MDEAGILPIYTGIATHDCWSSYWKYPKVTHAVCCAHLLRELKGVQENHKDQTWSKQFSDLLMEMKHARDKAEGEGAEALSGDILEQFDTRYSDIIALAISENPLEKPKPGKRGKPKKGKIRALIDRLSEYKDSVMLFTKDFRVDFDNNLAERDLRNIKVKVKGLRMLQDRRWSKGLPEDHVIYRNSSQAWKECLRGHQSCLFKRSRFHLLLKGT